MSQNLGPSTTFDPNVVRIILGSSLTDIRNKAQQILTSQVNSTENLKVVLPVKIFSITTTWMRRYESRPGSPLSLITYNALMRASLINGKKFSPILSVIKVCGQTIYPDRRFIRSISCTFNRSSLNK